MTGTLLLTSLSSVQGNTTAVTLLATMGRLFSSWASTVTSVYIQELFPTTIRQVNIYVYINIYFIWVVPHTHKATV